MSKVYIGDIGTVIEVAVGIDISAATTTELKVKKPDGTTDTWVGAVNGSTNTQLDYTIAADDLDQSGEYDIQAHIETATWVGLGETARLMVYGLFQ